MSLSQYMKQFTVAAGVTAATLSGTFDAGARDRNAERALGNAAIGFGLGLLQGQRGFQPSYNGYNDGCIVQKYRSNGNPGGTENICTERGRRNMQNYQQQYRQQYQQPYRVPQLRECANGPCYR